MQELCLAVALVAAAVGGVEFVATIAVGWTSDLAESDDLEDMLDLDVDQPELGPDGDAPATESETLSPADPL